MIVVSLGDIVNNIQLFIDISNKPMRAKMAYRFSKIISTVTEEYNRYQKIRNQLVDKYGNKNGDGTLQYNDDRNVVVTYENQQKFYEENENLLAEKVMIDVDKFDLVDFDQMEFTPAQMVILGKFVE